MSSGLRSVVTARNLGDVPSRAKTPLRNIAAWPALLLSGILFPAMQAQGLQSICQKSNSAATIARSSVQSLAESRDCGRPAIVTMAEDPSQAPSLQLIVIGFMGGRVKGDNLVHREALLAKQLRENYPRRVYAAVFANHDAQNALNTINHLLDQNRDGSLSEQEKGAARIVIYGHSWGASETIALARRLNTLGIPVLLTVQVDSVEKPNENDEDIPPNVHEAINFYQTQGLLHGRSLIEAMDPRQTTILGNYESSYRKSPISCDNFPWFARAFMKPHIEIENDPSIWARIAALIRTKLR